VKEAFARKDVRYEHKFRSGKEPLAQITIPQEYLLYRLENYRTRDQQLSLVAANKAPEDFFAPKRREDPSVQEAQHQLLLELAKKGSGETIKPILDELARVGEQTEPLIITSDGVVVNGNRRLCAMRHLLKSEDKSSYGSFRNVLSLVLPASTTEKEILELEIGLQMQTETKLPYEWTALGRAVRDLRAQQFSDDAIASLMNRDKQDIQRAARMIDAADLYLREWLGRPNAYNELDDTEQAFKQIAVKNLARADGIELREQTRKFDFFVIENRRRLTDSAYSLINAIESNPAVFLDRLATEWDVDLKPVDVEPTEISFEDAETKTFDYSPLLERLEKARGDESDCQARLSSLEQVCVMVGEQSKGREKAALNFARKAERALAAIDIRTADPGTHREILEVMSRCIELCQRVDDDLTQRATHS
jgi:hypothetical protein